MQQPDLCMALPLHVSPLCAFPPAGTLRCGAALIRSTAAASYKNSSGADGWLTQGRDSADIPLLGCSMRIHVPCCFTMEEKQRPPPSPTQHQTSRGRRRGEAESLPGVWSGGWVGWGESVCLCLRLHRSKKESTVCIYDVKMKEGLSMRTYSYKHIHHNVDVC